MGVEAAAPDLGQRCVIIYTFRNATSRSIVSSLFLSSHFSLQEAIEFGYRCVCLLFEKLEKHSKYLIDDEEMQLEPIKFINYSLAQRSPFGQLLLPWIYLRIIMLGEFP